MPSATTRAAARAQLLRYFAETLRALPTGTSLALRHPDLPAAGFHHGVTLPHDDDPDSSAEFFDISYWMVGVGPAESDRYFDLVLRAWRALGAESATDRPTRPRNGYARTSDGYALTITQSVTGHLGLSCSTPPFESAPAEEEAFPDRIDHPSAAT
ncbi:hypothetical protein [Nocardia sp. X0981]